GVQLAEPLVQLGEDVGEMPILIEALAFGRLANGFAVIVIAHRGKGWTVSSGSVRIDHLMQVWDAAARKPLGEPHVIDEDWVTALTCGFLSKTAVAVSCSQGGTFRIW